MCVYVCVKDDFKRILLLTFLNKPDLISLDTVKRF